ncbi:MAG: tyrosine-type recombinase/integrase [Sulfitobacter sp.]|nr:tyrosine-type recombinase/integrase [Sulfitobacter sp.]
MNTLREAIDDYLLLRRDLGFKLIQTEHWLHDFAAFMEDRQASFITVERALQWALRPSDAKPPCWAKRLSAVRLFARYRSMTDPRTEVPPVGLLPYHPRRAKPYWYTEEDIAALMSAARALPPPGGLRGRTYACLLGLLAVTGLRIGEALRLKREDVDLEYKLLTIHGTKFDKSRLVPLHPSTDSALSAYAGQRDGCFGQAKPDHFFVSPRGTSLTPSSVRRTFRLLCRQVGLQGLDGCDEPRLHHFRHRFATETLLQWYRSSEDIERQLPVLSTFLGHACIADTYWYLSAQPELMGEALQRLEQRWEKSS